MITVSNAHMSKGNQPVYIAEVPMVLLKDLQAAWIKRLQENIKVKVTDMKGELVLANVIKPEIAPDTISLYTHLIEKEGKVIMNVFLEIDSVFFSPQEDKSQLASDKIDNNLRNYIRKFAVEQYKLTAAKSFDTEQTTLKTKENELEKLVKEEENLKKDISSLENEIEKKEREVSDLDREIQVKDQELAGHRTSMLELVMESDKTAAKERDKELEKDKKKLEKDRQKAKDDISGMKNKIEKNQQAIEDSEKAQEAKKEEITAQQAAVARAQEFLNGIK